MHRTVHNNIYVQYVHVHYRKWSEKNRAEMDSLLASIFVHALDPIYIEMDG